MTLLKPCTKNKQTYKLTHKSTNNKTKHVQVSATYESCQICVHGNCSLKQNKLYLHCDLAIGIHMMIFNTSNGFTFVDWKN